MNTFTTNLDPDLLRRHLVLQLKLPSSPRGDQHAIDFLAEHTRELQQLGVDLPQLARLRRALRVIHLYTLPGPKVADVRAPLRRLKKHADAVTREIGALVNAPDNDEARQEARQRLLEALCRFRAVPSSGRSSFHAPYDDRVDALLALAAELQDTVTLALNGLQGQTRTLALPYPVAYIHRALAFDFMLERQSEFPAWDGYPFKPSTTAECAFANVVRVCYEAAHGCKTNAPHAFTTEPERAIRAFVKAWTADAENYRAALRAPPGTPPHDQP